MITTKFHSLTIEHPHSGEVSRSQIETLIIHYQKEFPIGGNDSRTRKERAKAAAERMSNYGDVVVLKDENGKVRIGGHFQS